MIAQVYIYSAAGLCAIALLVYLVVALFRAEAL
jgi:K+-transporting ATPase KdpF subunit